MNETMSERPRVAVSCAPHDEAAAEPIVAGLRAEGLNLVADEGAVALLFFTSRASLSSDASFDQALAAHTRGAAIVPVLLEPIALPGDLPARFAPLLRAENAVEAFDRPEEEKRRGVIAMLAGLGVATAGAGVAEAGSIGTQSGTPHAAGAQSSSSAATVKIDPLAKSNAGVVKASSKLSMKTVAFGGAAAATLLVVGAIVLMQDGKDRPAAPANAVAGGPSTASTAPQQGGRSSDPGATPADIETGGARAILQQASYPAGYPIPVRVEGMPGHVRDYVAITEAGASGFSEVRYEYLQGQKAGDIVLRPVMKPGNYEVRLFFGNDEESHRSDRVRFSTPLTITPADPITLTPEATTLTEGQPVRIRYEGLPGNDKDWLSTAAADSPDGNYIAYRYTNGAKTGTIELPPLVKPGKYEVRVYFDDLTSDRTVQARVALDVTAAPPVGLTLDAPVYAPSATITVNFTGLPGNQKDWLAIARPGDDGYLNYEYTAGKTAGSQTLRAPDEPGTYEVRAYFDDSTGDKTVRAVASFRVDPSAPPPSQP